MSQWISSKSYLAIGAALVLLAPLNGAQAKTKETVLYSFAGGSDGAKPKSGLLLDKKGNFFGVTNQGGTTNLGTVFKLAPDGTETVLYTFAGSSDGAYPLSRLIADKKGNMIGTTSGADISSDFGTVFRVTPGGKEKVLHTFTNTDGNSPQAGLLMDAAGNMYGTVGAGAVGAGAVFKLASDGTYSLIYSFLNGADGASPAGNLIADANGDLYSTTYFGGDHGWGTVFKVTPGGTHTVLYSFTGGADGRDPSTGLTADKKGNLYGTTYFGGGADAGTVFKLAKNGTETVLHSFTTGKDGANPLGNLLLDKKGNLYGTANQGGANGAGTVFRISPQGKFTTVYAFKSGGTGDGANPAGDLLMDGSGTLYGTTINGGDHAIGAIYRLKLQ